MRRLPVYILIDTSGSMVGEPIQSVITGLQTMVATLRQDPYALDSVYQSIISYGKGAKSEMDLTELSKVILPNIDVPQSAPTFMGAGLKLLRERMNEEVIHSTDDAKGDWMPLLFIMTDGKPSDLQDFNEEVQNIKKIKFGSIIGCAAGPKAKEEYLQQFCDQVVTLDTTDASVFQQFFKWVSASVSVGNKSIGASDDIQLPPPPEEINLVI